MAAFGLAHPGGVETDAVVGDGEADLFLGDLFSYLHMLGPGVFGDIVQSLLDDT